MTATPSASGSAATVDNESAAAALGRDDEAAGAPQPPHGYTPDKQQYLRRLKRIEGQARGIHRMVEEDAYCIDVLTQISAITSALENVALGLLDDHLHHCVVNAARAGGPESTAKIKEAFEAINRLVKS